MSVFDRFKKEKEQTKKKSSVKAASSSQKPEEKKEAKKATASKSSAAKGRMLSKNAALTILAPIVSEKSAMLADANTLVFKVDMRSNKTEVRNAFRELYQVTPLRVNIVTVRGKRVRFGRIEGKQSDVKKALITLPKGVRVDIFEGV